MCVLRFSTNYAWNIFHSKKNRARCDRKCVLVFIIIIIIIIIILFLSEFMKLEFLWTDFREKILKYQISWKSVQ